MWGEWQWSVSTRAPVHIYFLVCQHVHVCACLRGWKVAKWAETLSQPQEVSSKGWGCLRLCACYWKKHIYYGCRPTSPPAARLDNVCPNLDPDLRSSHSLNIPSLLQLHTINLHSSPGGKKTSSGDVNGVKQITLLSSLLFTPSSQFTCRVPPTTHTSLHGWRLTITVALNNGQPSYHGDFNKTAVSALLFLNLDAVPLSSGWLKMLFWCLHSVPDFTASLLWLRPPDARAGLLTSGVGPSSCYKTVTLFTHHVFSQAISFVCMCPYS